MVGADESTELWDSPSMALNVNAPIAMKENCE